MGRRELDFDACYRALRTRDPRFDGRFFVAVKTTGIYCRPICPARTTKRENVTFYETALEAHTAGYRPCLRCRPEISPQLAVWGGTSATVSRALSLIAEGALDENAVENLAGRLGVGARQLRRLFRQHLGTSPISVAQMRRVLFAKQLIAETRMPLAEVAFASGFGSVRRFNTTFQNLFQRPPRELRRNAEVRASGELSGTSGVVLRLPFAKPYDFQAILAFLRKRSIPDVETVDDDVYCRTIALEGSLGTVEVTREGNSNYLLAKISFPDVKALVQIVGRLGRIFDLSADPLAIERHLATDQRLLPLVSAASGLRVPGAWDGFELAVRAVLGQQISVAAATQLCGKLVGKYGLVYRSPLAVPRLTRVFPPAQVLATVNFAELGMPTARANTLRALAEVALLQPELFEPSHWGLTEHVRRLRQIPGIGEWTAQYIAMRALREPDAFPAADIGLQRAMADEHGVRPTPQELALSAEAWRPWRAYATLHLWNSEHKRELEHVRSHSKGKHYAAAISA